jgi:hypothetical protein
MCVVNVVSSLPGMPTPRRIHAAFRWVVYAVSVSPSHDLEFAPEVVARDNPGDDLGLGRVELLDHLDAARPVLKDPKRLRHALTLVGGRLIRGVEQRLGAPLVAQRHASEIAHEFAGSPLDVVFVHPR